MWVESTWMIWTTIFLIDRWCWFLTGRHCGQQQPEQQQLLISISHVWLGVSDHRQQSGQLSLHPRTRSKDALPAKKPVCVILKWSRTRDYLNSLTQFDLSLCHRQEDENMNQHKDPTSFLHNGNGAETLQALLKSQQSPPEKMGDYDLSMEARLAFIEKGINNGVGETYKWDQINMNVSKMQTDNMVQLDEVDKTKNRTVTREDLNGKQGYSNENMEHFLNGNQQVGLGNKSQAMRVETSAAHVASTGVTASSDMSLSRSTEELSPEKRCQPPQVMKSHSVSNIEVGGMKVYSFDGDSDAYDTAGTMRGAGAGPGPGAQGQSIVRSKSAGQLLNDPALQVYQSSSASSSDLLSSSKPCASTSTSTSRYPVSSSMSMGVPPPQYNIQYTSSSMPKDGLWAPRTPVPPEHQGYLPPPPPHSLANTNYSNRNQAPPYPLQPLQRGAPMCPKPSGDMWADRLHSTGGQSRSSTLQRQSSAASTASIGDSRRIQIPDGEYMTYRDIHTLARGPLAMSHAMHRPLSARTYSIDVPGGSRPLSGRPQPHELPERTMSVSDFNYQHSSPSKRPTARVSSEHSLLDGPGQMSGGAGRVPMDWRDQVMRHIEAKKMEKVKRCFCPFTCQRISEDLLSLLYLKNIHLKEVVVLSEVANCHTSLTHCFQNGSFTACVSAFALSLLFKLIGWVAWPPLMSVGAGCSVSSSVQSALSRSFNSYNSPLSRSHYTSCRDMHASQGSLVFSARDGQPRTALGLCVSTEPEVSFSACEAWASC